jgi:putative transposase
MPAKFRVKKYVPGGVYYIYSRAGEGRNIFEDDEDYKFFLKLMDRYLGQVKAETDTRFKTERPYRLKYKQQMNLVGEVQILAYCLMRHNIQLLVWQKNPDGLTKLMRRLLTNYTMYINRRHRQRGKVFAGVYKGILVKPGAEMVYLSRQIHRAPAGKKVFRFGPVETVSGFTPEEYLYSSLGNFLKSQQTGWVNPEPILVEFEKMKGGQWKSYREFVNDEKVVDENRDLMN